MRGGNPAAYGKSKSKSPPETENMYVMKLSPPTSSTGSVSNSSDHNTNNNQPEISPWLRRYDNSRGDILFTQGQRVGINNSEPNEALSVRGNIEMTGNLMRPSDARIKRNFQSTDQTSQLDKIKAVNLYDYERCDLQTGEWVPERGVIAQELRQVIPDAVTVKGDVVLPNGETIKDFCTVNERTLMIDHIGATQALATEVDDLKHAQKEELIPQLKKKVNRCELWSVTLCCTVIIIILLLLIGAFSTTYLVMSHPEQNDVGNSSNPQSTNTTTTGSPSNNGNNGNNSGSPGNSGNAPGHSGDSPGNNGNSPGASPANGYYNNYYDYNYYCGTGNGNGNGNSGQGSGNGNSGQCKAFVRDIMKIQMQYNNVGAPEFSFKPIYA